MNWIDDNDDEGDNHNYDVMYTYVYTKLTL